MQKTYNTRDVKREKMTQKLLFKHMEKPFTEKEIAEMYFKTDKAREKLSKEIDEAEEGSDMDALIKLKKLQKKYYKAGIANVAILYFEIRIGANHNKVEKEYKRLEKEAA